MQTSSSPAKTQKGLQVQARLHRAILDLSARKGRVHYLANDFSMSPCPVRMYSENYKAHDLSHVNYCEKSLVRFGSFVSCWLSKNNATRCPIFIPPPVSLCARRRLTIKKRTTLLLTGLRRLVVLVDVWYRAVQSRNEIQT